MQVYGGHRLRESQQTLRSLALSPWFATFDGSTTAVIPDEGTLERPHLNSPAFRGTGPTRSARGIVIALALGLLGCSLQGPGEEPENATVPVATVERTNFVVTVSATGTIEPEAQVEVKSKASGEIVEFPFQAGDPVRAGELVCRLDPSDEERNVERRLRELQSARARLVNAEAALRLAEADRSQALRETAAALEESAARVDEARARLARDEALLVQGVASVEEAEASRTRQAEARAALERAHANRDRAESRADDVERARQEVLRAEADLSTAQIALDEARERLRETRILAPRAGVVTETLVEAGQVISSAISNVGGGTSLLKIADLSRLYVLLPVDEVDIGRIRRGQEARIRVDAFPERVFQGQVVQLAPVGTEEQNVVLFDVKVSVDDESVADLLRPGMTADVEVEVARSDDTLWIPREALNPESAQVQVVGEGESYEVRDVRIGLRDAHRVEILAGLAEGETVALAGSGVPSQWRKDEGGSRRSATTRFLWRLRRK